MTGDLQRDLRAEAERIAGEILKRGGKAMRHQGEWLVSTKEANKLLPYGSRYIQSLRGTSRESRSISFSAPDSPSKHYWYWVVDILALARIHGAEEYFSKSHKATSSYID